MSINLEAFENSLARMLLHIYFIYHVHLDVWKISMIMYITLLENCSVVSVTYVYVVSYIRMYYNYFLCNLKCESFI